MQEECQKSKGIGEFYDLKKLISMVKEFRKIKNRRLIMPSAIKKNMKNEFVAFRYLSPAPGRRVHDSEQGKS